MTEAVSQHRKKRGVTRTSITCLSTRIEQLKGHCDRPDTLGHTQQLAHKLDSLSGEFKSQHYAVIELIDDEETLEKEQDIFDSVDDKILELTIQQLIASLALPSNDSAKLDLHKIASRRLVRLKESITTIDNSINALPDGPKDDIICALQLYETEHSRLWATSHPAHFLPQS